MNRRLLLETLVPAIALFACALAIRAATMVNGFSLDGDECLFANIVSTSTWGNLLEVLRHDWNPPLMYVLAKLWCAIFGTSDYSFKWLALLISAAIPVAAFAFMRTRLATSAAIAVAALCCVAPPLVDITTRVRPYGLMVLLGLCSLAALDKLLKAPHDRKSQLTYAVALSALLYTHLSSLVLAFGQVLACLGSAIVAHDKSRARGFCLSVLIAAIVLSPLAIGELSAVSTSGMGHGFGVPVLHVLKTIPLYTFSLVEAGMFNSSDLAFYVPLILFYGMIAVAAISAGRIAKTFPNFDYVAWVVSFVAMVALQILIGTQMLRYAYVVNLTVPAIVLMVALLRTYFTPDKAMLANALAFFMLIFWVPNLKDMHAAQQPTMQNLFNYINKDQSSAGKPSLLVVSNGWYAPVAYRYLDHKIECIVFPDVDAPLQYVDWDGYTDKLADHARMDKLLKLIADRLDHGYSIYHMFVVFPPGQLVAPMPNLSTKAAVQVQTFLAQHARAEKMFDAFCYQAPGIMDRMRTCKFAPPHI
ncbi:MAG TPA: glycosyltransferase family 39 protein [Candidatus Obscuribacterales bacterium]